ncbi:MAG: NAD(P)-dependent oxidoreductase [Lachnospiraceae bacterium]|nr:NAD(P)-dependent oxidoreductase [Lachnospiraceae bacterium]
MKKVFMTGATGFIGIHLLREMRKRGTEVWALCRESSREYEAVKKIAGVHIVGCGLEDVQTVLKLCREREFDAFYHLAWNGASGPLRKEYGVQLQNVKWTCDCVKAAKFLQCKKIIVTGTVCENQCSAIDGLEEFVGASYYLFAKRYAHRLAREISKELDMPLVWCQFYHPIGVFNKKEQIIADTIQKLLHQESLRFGPANGLFDVIDVRDLACALYKMGETALKNDTYFIGSGSPRRLKEYLEDIKEILDPFADMQYGSIKTADLPMERAWLDPSAFQEETGFIPSISFSESVEEMRTWLENEKRYDFEKWFF